MKKTPPVLHETIVLGGKKIPFTLARKPIKNLNLRVRSDGSVALSVPLKTPQSRAMEFLSAHADFLLSALARMEKRRAQLPPKVRFGAGETILIFGEPTPIEVKAGARTSGALQNGRLVLTIPDPENARQRKRAAEQFAKAALSERISAFCKAAEADFRQFKIPAPTVKYRNMRSRWGSCNTKKAIVTFALSLVGAPEKAIEYVVYHEFAHLVYPDHSKKFYALVEDFLPDWKARKAMLRNIPCALFA